MFSDHKTKLNFKLMTERYLEDYQIFRNKIWTQGTELKRDSSSFSLSLKKENERMQRFQQNENSVIQE